MNMINPTNCSGSILFPEKGKEKAKITRLFTRPDLWKIKSSLNVTAEQLAVCLGVSPSLANGWLNGTRKPIGPARKLLLLLEGDPSLAEKLKAL
ncbi:MULTISPECIES: helix-turn-helix domain-containing protein [Pantoea]|uniref:Putative transcriptional regulator n=1 Tax=Candidatus Pantoea floridensis TaxID=1938870 RepID=A0A286C022_9GAMM|nr:MULTISPECIES: hypothetical protein [Pantoea]PIF22236.1 putative transcriptional regulator [Enterobacteriaceae bacterium JKS000233]PXW18482.1 putative transcriptional regulator [Pantoea sp. JKS000250]SOD39743.1 putative transcriptional regulator [Pantoea floridensis]